MSGGICIFSKKNLPLGAMMSLMALHHIVMQYKNAGAHGGIDGHGLTLTDIVGNNWKVWREAVGWAGMHCAALQCLGVVIVVELFLIVNAYVAVLANPGMKHRNADGVTRGRAIGDKPCAHSR